MLEKYKTIFEKIYHKINFVLEFIFSILLGISLFKILYIRNYTDLIAKKWTVLFFMFLVIVLAIMIINIIKYKDKIEKLFTTIAIPLGIMYLIFVIPNGVPDENAHISRIYDISKGNIISKICEDGNTYIEVPKYFVENDINQVNSYNLLNSKISEKTDYNDTKYVYSGALGYCATMYAPSSIIFFLARKIGLNFFITVYLARIVNFIIFLIVAYYSIKLIPFGKLLFSTYMLTPMILQQAMSVSSDSLINTLLLFFIAYSLYIFKTDTKFTIPKKILYYSLCVFLGTAKYVYFPLVGLSLICINSKIFNKKDKIKIILTSIISVLILSVISYIISTKYQLNPAVINNNVDSKGQLIYILKNPLKYMLTFTRTIHENMEFYISTFLGAKLGWLDINVNNISILILVLLLFFAPFVEKNEMNLKRNEKFILILILFISFAIIITGLYLTWTPIGSSLILGVQGRYFIPIFILPLLCLIDKEKYIKFSKIYLIYFILLVYINSTALMEVIKFYLK